MRVVSNSGPIIHLSWIDHIQLLSALFDEVLVPTAVRVEVLEGAGDLPGMPAIRSAFASHLLTVAEVGDFRAVEQIESTLHRGEAEALVLMQERQADLLLLDDRDAREYALARGLPISGTLGVLRMARQRGFIESAYVELQRLEISGFRISSELVEMVQHEESGR